MPKTYILTTLSARLAVIGMLLLFSCSDAVKSRQRNRTEKQLPEKGKTVAVTPTYVRAKYNILIENSGSMNGYVAQSSDFKDAIFGLITDLRSKNVTDVINIYYINQQLCPQKMGAMPNEIEYFFTHLNPASLNRSGCGTHTSFIPEIIQKAVNSNTNDVNILISDFIFSDSLGASTQYLEAAKNTVKLYLSEALKNREISMIILKLNSQFEGFYYMESKRPLKVDLSNKKIRRPYYIIIFGNQAPLEHFLSKINFNDYKGFENSYYLLKPAGSRPAAKIVRNNKIGDYEIEQPSTNLVINNAKTGGRNGDEEVFQFSLAANLDFLKMDDSYITDPGNYNVSNNYTITSITRNTDETNESLKGYTHLFTCKTSDLKPLQEVSIRLKSKLPSWVQASSTVDDSNPFDSAQQRQTFGFEYLARGISEAYANHNEGKEQLAITIKISKNKYAEHGKTSSFPWWIVIVLAALFGIIIWIKNKK
ncbi:hypothetical protein FAM09_13115 [Niastella caeni]|uniref:VWA domain-containing protein n=1 Tax=Niastella caeni TaxID=2569763 RepID=A0A4S8HXD4_9BACT|nr:hypothetical protein [Niastella caeni]THU39439.1 hypothetical protein FAM09_13115 [Niastella caeni]